MLRTSIRLILSRQVPQLLYLDRGLSIVTGLVVNVFGNLKSIERCVTLGERIKPLLRSPHSLVFLFASPHSTNLCLSLHFIQSLHISHPFILISHFTCTISFFFSLIISFSSTTTMDPNSNEIVREFPHLFRLYKDGRVERFLGTETTPPGTDPQTGVNSKDITINSQTGIGARLYLPPNAASSKKLPLLIYIHGGAFCVCTPFNPGYHRHLNNVAAQANVVIFSVHYRLAPEHPLPIAYDDTWEAIQWVSTTASDPWIKDHADLNHVFFAGDSAGANLAHNMAMRGSTEGLRELKLQGMVLIHPFFGNEENDELIKFLYPTYGGFDDLKIHAVKDPKLSGLGCKRVLVLVADKDFLKERGKRYYEGLKKSGWSGVVEMAETEGEGHCFHLFGPTKEKSVALVKQFVSFMTQN